VAAVNRVAKRAVTILIFGLHQLFCPYVLLALSAFLTFAATPLVHLFGTPATTRTAHWVLTETPYFPVQITLGLISGFVIGRFRRIPFTTWMWAIPFLVLIAALIFKPLQPGQARLDHFFGWGGLPPHRQYDEIAITLPFYISAAYALAAQLSSRTQHRDVQTVVTPA
jgi:hypothetical protein